MPTAFNRCGLPLNQIPRRSAGGTPIGEIGGEPVTLRQTVAPRLGCDRLDAVDGRGGWPPRGARNHSAKRHSAWWRELTATTEKEKAADPLPGISGLMPNCASNVGSEHLSLLGCRRQVVGAPHKSERATK